MKDRLSILGFAALAAVATAGWMRQPSVRLADITSNLQAPSAVLTAQNSAELTGADAYNGAAEPQRVHDAVYREAQVTRAESTYPTQRVRNTHRVSNQSAVPVRTVADRYDDRNYDNRNYDYRTRDRQVEQSGSTYSNGPYIQRERSTAKSAAIIAGGAAVGAAIGGMAGHGKGAAIGALSGGALATVYDRMTHKKTDGWGWKQ
jgi:hypothetical protein